jgi:hypothetical protein
MIGWLDRGWDRLAEMPLMQENSAAMDIHTGLIAGEKKLSAPNR